MSISPLLVLLSLIYFAAPRTRLGRPQSSTLGAVFLLLSSRVARFLVFSLYVCNDVGADQQQELIRRIDAAEVTRAANLNAYTATEHYTIRNSHVSKPAEVMVETTYKRGRGKTYKVLWRNGPSLLANGVMDRLLGEETQMSHAGALEQAVITSANYDMKLVGQESVDGRICDMVELVPKRKSPYLLKGRMWVDASDTMLVKIEGKPPVSLSFFEGRPQIVREYRTIAGFAFAVRSHAASHNFLFGQSTVDIEYRDYHVITLRLSQKPSPK